MEEPLYPKQGRPKDPNGRGTAVWIKPAMARLIEKDSRPANTVVNEIIEAHYSESTS